MSDNLFQIAKERILILDGAMGTMIQRHKLDENDFRGKATTPNEIFGSTSPTKPV